MTHPHLGEIQEYSKPKFVQKPNPPPFTTCIKTNKYLSITKIKPVIIKKHSPTPLINVNMSGGGYVCRLTPKIKRICLKVQNILFKRFKKKPTLEQLERYLRICRSNEDNFVKSILKLDREFLAFWILSSDSIGET